ncbi:hypothetical protein TRICI_005066 [Trichomonascus ciferrii]|uniref:Reverse transcriptase Ty1/copia-type domain-containing protein n=1 Tax=Trichomonascus ciferrii TaxID=44093 RepID=A0A642UY88_9ASCO|nr:hypothetical protein TRICI_005066 [Trichomonascus ciferrii]
MEDAFKSQLERGTLVKVEKLPQGKKPIPTKWVFQVEDDLSGRVTRFKGRLVEKGFRQQKYRDYGDTFSPTLTVENLRTALGSAATKDMIIHQVHIKTAFLYSNLIEELYVTLPKGTFKKQDPGLG